MDASTRPTMLPELSTERLLLRAYTDADAPRVLDIQSRLEVVRWLGNPPFHLMADLDQARAWIADWPDLHARDVRCGGWAIEVRESGVVAGTAMVTSVPNDDEGLVQLGWHLHPDSTGHGYATEAAAAVRDHAFEHGADVLWCGMYPDNAPSAAVAVRLGLEDLGVRPDPWYGGDSRMFRVTREQHEARRGEADGPA